MTALYQNRQIRELETTVISQNLIDELTLMQRAGQAAFNALQARWPQAKRITICCGKGNNGGDGFVVARLAYEQGLEVSLFSLLPINELKGSAQLAAKACEEASITLRSFPDVVSFENTDLIVDALLGSGLQGEVRGPYVSIIQSINDSKLPVLALDVASGIDVDTGNLLGMAVCAELTVTFIAFKQGLFTRKGPAYCGDIICDDLGVPHDLFKKLTPSAELLNWELIKKGLPRRQRDTYKGDYGHVLVVGGDYGMGGAVRMAAEAAMRVGAGLVSVATRPEHVPVVSTNRPEIMCHQVVGAEDLLPLLDKATVVVIGPGLGKSDWAKDLLNTILDSNLPKLLDADALNLLSESPRVSDQWVLTPHPGEASRLLAMKCPEVQVDRFAAVEKLQKQYGGISVLKGAGTIIKSPEQRPKVCPAGNPGMATGGMGDILSGVIGGLLAQGLDLQGAAEMGVMLHAKAGDLAADEGGERGLLATDLLSHLRVLANP